MNTMAIIIICAAVLIAIVAIGGTMFGRKRRSEKLRTRFGGAEYDRALQEGGSRRSGEAGKRASIRERIGWRVSHSAAQCGRS